MLVFNFEGDYFGWGCLFGGDYLECDCSERDCFVVDSFEHDLFEVKRCCPFWPVFCSSLSGINLVSVFLSLLAFL